LSDYSHYTFYISGPMTGYEEFNFPAFFEAEEQLTNLGIPSDQIVNPAKNGRDIGDWASYLRLDLKNLCNGCEAVVVLDGWRDSRGAKLEVYVAQQLGMPIFKLVHRFEDRYRLVPLEESVIEEAHRIINGPRQEFYGHPLDNMRKTAGILNSMFENKLKEPLTEEDITLLMMGVKLARQVHRPQRDNIVDIIGYAGCYEKVEVERKRREDIKNQGY
jgi:hypothetical protein